MESDGELYFYHHYIQKGFTVEYLQNLDYYSRILYQASLDLEMEQKIELEKLRAELLKDEKAHAVVTF